MIQGIHKPWAPAKVFVGGGGGQAQKRPPHKEKKAPTWKKEAYRPPKGDKLSKKAPTKRKGSKKAPYIAKHFFIRFPWGGHGLFLHPPPAGAHGSNPKPKLSFYFKKSRKSYRQMKQIINENKAGGGGRVPVNIF